MASASDPPLPWLLAAMASIAASSLFYTYIWYRPKDYVRLVHPSDPCTNMAWWANVLKVAQYVSIAACTNWSSVLAAASNPSTLLPALLLLGMGQHLNYKVYQLLGMNGVYYGYRFGKSIPWVEQYPYSVMRDPQYIGCILSLGGAALMGAPTELCMWWLANYLYLMWVESKVPDGVY